MAMRILWLSDTPLRMSGFGIVSGEVGRRLAARGCEVTFLGWWGDGRRRHFAGLGVEPCPVAPAEAAPVLAAWLDRLRPDFLVSLADLPWIAWLASREVAGALRRNGTRWCCHFPIDGTRRDGMLPPDWRRTLSHADLAVAMSGYGAAACARSGMKAAYVPHGCDTTLFTPPDRREASKRHLGYDGRFVILADTRNHRRKLLPRMLDIVRRAALPDEAFLLHLHTNLRPGEDRDSYAYDLRADLAVSGLARQVRLDDGYGRLGAGELAALYAAADVHLQTSYGEGFGLPTLQAASAGVVPIGGDHSANGELLADHGFAIPASHEAVDEFGIVRPFIDRDAAAAALRRLFEDPDLLRERSRAARDFALGYDWEPVADRWAALLGASAGRPPARLARRRSAPARAALPAGPGDRPTGHASDVLPLPRIAIPTRLPRPRGHARPALTVLADPAVCETLAPLRALFPGLRIAAPRSILPISRRALLSEMKEAILVADPDGALHPDSDLICASAGISFLGGARVWPPVPANSLLLQARLLLTDHALAAERARQARDAVRRDRRKPVSSPVGAASG